MNVPLLPALLTGSFLVILYMVVILTMSTPSAALLWLAIALCVGNLVGLLRPLPRGVMLSLAGLNALAAAVVLVVVLRTLSSGGVAPDLARFMPVLLYLFVFVPLIAALHLVRPVRESRGGPSAVP